jgi:hypothetical protein
MTEDELNELRHQASRELGPDLGGLLVDLLAGEHVNEAALHQAAFAYFDRCAAADPPINPDAYFNWINGVVLASDAASVASGEFWDVALRIAHEWESSRDQHQHKGSGYYFAGLRDARLGNLDRAFLYINQAVVEDAWHARNIDPTSPAGWFVTLNDTTAAQAGFEVVAAHAAYLERHLSFYRASARGGLTQEGLRRRALRRRRLAFAMTALAHTVARLVQIENQPPEISQNAYAALLRSQVHLELCQVIEEALLLATGQRKRSDRFGRLLRAYIKGRPELGLTLDQVKAVEGASFNRLEPLLRQLIGGRRVFGVDGLLTRTGTDLLVALLVRNWSAHALYRPAAREFDRVTPHLFYALFRAIEWL